MSKTGRGRPRKEVNKIIINDLLVEYLTTKEYYGSDTAYFKIIDPGYKNKLKPIFSVVEEDMKMPTWQGDNGLYIPKVEDRFINYFNDLVRNNMYTVDIDFEMYNLETNDKQIRGYYAKLPKVVHACSDTPIQVEVNNDN